MMCSPEFMAAEDRDTVVIRSVVHFRFVFSKLYLEYEENGVRFTDFCWRTDHRYI